MIRLAAIEDVLALRAVFRISRGARTEQRVVRVRLDDGDAVGRGECTPYPRYGESVASVLAQIESVRAAVERGAGRDDLAALLPAGAARNAVDCALWDLEAKRACCRVWELAGLPAPAPVVTACTLSVDEPAAMRAAAAALADRPLLKTKLTGDGDLERLAAVRDGAPRARLIADANEGWTAAHYAEYAPRLAGFGVEMVEQPLPAGADEGLAKLARTIPVCADESCHDTATLAGLAGRYDAVNVKLDKTGGLTEALRLRAAARAAGLKVMVGCMIGSSLAMAPAVLVAQGADWVDLDGPLWLAADCRPGLAYDGAVVHPPPATLWG